MAQGKETDGPRHEAMRGAAVSKGREEVIEAHTELMAERSEDMFGESLLEDLLIAYKGRRIAVVLDQDGHNVTGTVVDGREDGVLLQLDHSGKVTYVSRSALWGLILDAEPMTAPSRSRKMRPEPMNQATN